jgi:hypothetical protein
MNTTEKILVQGARVPTIKAAFDQIREEARQELAREVIRLMAQDDRENLFQLLNDLTKGPSQ